MSENETSLGIKIDIKDHDGVGIDVNGLKAEDQLITGVISSVDHNIGIANIQLVRVSHKEPVVFQVTLSEAKDVHSKLIVRIVAENVEIFADRIVNDFTDHSNFEFHVNVYLLLLVAILEIEVDGVLMS